MSRKLIKLQYNSPVVLTFALLSLAVLWLDGLTGGKSTHALFSVYRSSFADLGTDRSLHKISLPLSFRPQPGFCYSCQE